MRSPWLLLFLLAGLATPGRAALHERLEKKLARVSEQLTEAPGDPQLWLLRAELYRLHGQAKEARADLAQAREIDTELSAAWLIEARLDLGDRRFEQARVASERFVAAAPNDAAGWSVMAEACAALGDRKSAIRACRRALDVCDPPRPEDYLRLVDLITGGVTANLTLARDVLDEGLARLGLEPSMQLRAIEIEEALGEWDAALARVDAILARASRIDHWLERRASVLAHAGRIKAAIESYQSALVAIRELPSRARRTQATRERVLRVQVQLDALRSTLDSPDGSHQ